MSIKVNQVGVSHAMHLAQTGRVVHGKWNEAGIGRNEKNKEKFLAVDDDFKPDEVGHWKYPVVGNDGKLNRKAVGSAQAYAEKNGEGDVAAACKKIGEAADKSPDHRSAARDFEVRYLPLKSAEIRTSQDGTNVVLEGYAARFNSMSQMMAADDDAPVEKGTPFREVVIPGAFTRTLSSGADIRLLANHQGLPVARTRSGTMACAEDEAGLRFRATLDPTDPDALSILKKVQRGDVDQCSFSFRCVEQAWRCDDQGNVVRELRELDLDDGDCSVVSYPAYKATSVGVRTLGDAYQEFRNQQKQQQEQQQQQQQQQEPEKVVPVSTLQLSLDLLEL